MIHVSHLRTSFDKTFNRFVRSFDGLRKLVHVLWLDNSFEIIFKNFREVV
jgi:hypothetical protein